MSSDTLSLMSRAQPDQSEPEATAAPEPEETVIRLVDVAKYYDIYAQPRDRLKQFVMPRMHRLLGKPPRRYSREFRALDGITFSVARGETVGIIGRNGSGKSTLLQMICGTLTPSRGEIDTQGRIAALLELGAGFDPEFTGRENVYMNASVLGLSQPEIDARLTDILAFADIGDFIDQPVKTYSSGMYVRLAFAVIAHVDADILVIDEALAVGDAFFVQKCMRFLRHFMEHGTVLFVSHDTSAVLNLCQRAIWLEDGQVVAEGSPKKVASAYLKAFFEGQQGASAEVASGDAEASDQQDSLTSAPVIHQVKRDMRQDLLNAGPYRNDLEIFQFDPAAEGFGKGGALIEEVSLRDADDYPLNWVVGGEEVTLSICARAQSEQPLMQPILGFYIKDRLGQPLFGDNTYLSYQSDPVTTLPGGVLEARFTFRMPILPQGNYSIGVAVADGTQHEHIQHHWLHDALMFKSHASSHSHGLVGIPMHHISLQVKPT